MTKEEILFEEIKFLRGLVESLIGQKVQIAAANPPPAEASGAEEAVYKRSQAIERHLSQILGSEDEEIMGDRRPSDLT